MDHHMKLGTIVTAAGVLLASAGIASAATVTNDLNIRSGPGTGYRVIGTLPAGTEVALLSCTGSWCRVNSSEGTGYVSANYVSGANAAEPEQFYADNYGDYDVPYDNYGYNDGYDYGRPYYDYGLGYGGFGFGVFGVNRGFNRYGGYRHFGGRDGSHFAGRGGGHYGGRDGSRVAGGNIGTVGAGGGRFARGGDGRIAGGTVGSGGNTFARGGGHFSGRGGGGVAGGNVGTVGSGGGSVARGGGGHFGGGGGHVGGGGGGHFGGGGGGHGGGGGGHGGGGGGHR
jgi:uncharacterized protein YraI